MISAINVMAIPFGICPGFGTGAPSNEHTHFQNAWMKPERADNQGHNHTQSKENKIWNTDKRKNVVHKRIIKKRTIIIIAVTVKKQEWLTIDLFYNFSKPCAKFLYIKCFCTLHQRHRIVIVPAIISASKEKSLLKNFHLFLLGKSPVTPSMLTSRSPPFPCHKTGIPRRGLLWVLYPHLLLWHEKPRAAW